jgi:hypothetical protein
MIIQLNFFAGKNNGSHRRSALLVAETGGLRENHRPVVIGTDCIGSCKSNYQTITATTKWGRFSMVTIHFSEDMITCM